MFLRHGYVGTSMDQIAAFAAVSKPTVYKFFPDKQQLFITIVLETIDKARAPFRAEISRLAETDDVAAGLRRLARGYQATVMQPQVLQLRRMVIGASHQLPVVAQTYYERAPARAMQSLAECFGRLHERGLLRRADPHMAAAHFAQLVMGRAVDKGLFCGDTPFPADELAAQADAGVAAFLAAYG